MGIDWESEGCSAWRRVQENLIAAFQYLNMAYKKDGMVFLVGPVATGQEVMVLN